MDRVMGGSETKRVHPSMGIIDVTAWIRCGRQTERVAPFRPSFSVRVPSVQQIFNVFSKRGRQLFDVDFTQV